MRRVTDAIVLGSNPSKTETKITVWCQFVIDCNLCVCVCVCCVFMHGIRKNGTATTLSPALTKMDPPLVALATTGEEKRRCHMATYEIKLM